MEPSNDDPSLREYQPSDLKIASEFHTTWLPFLTKDLCKDCIHVLSHRIRSLDQEYSSANTKTAARDDKPVSDVVVEDMDSEETDHNNLENDRDGKFSASETDKAGNPPGILQHGAVDPIPSLFKVIIKRLVGWHVLPPTCVPDTCIVNIYDEGDCIPPHIDNHDFLRPFCTVSFLSECDILFGSNLKIEGPGEFSGSYSLPLPVGSVLVLKGNGADVAKHCVPAVPQKRISITFRKMDESKRPVGFTPEPELQGIKPLPYEQTTQSDTPPVVAAIIPSRWSNDQDGGNYNSRGGGHREGRKHHESRRGYHQSESREWSSSGRRRGSSRHSPNTVYRPKVHTNNASSDNV